MGGGGATGGGGAATGGGGTTASVGGGLGIGGGGSEQGGGPTEPVRVGVFVAQGHQGRITRSCDDGRSFPFNVSADDTYPCFVDKDHDCDHSALAGRGLAFGAGSFVATWGWGHPGTLQRSTDGKTFDTVMTETPTFADVAYGNGTFVACGNPTRISVDGQVWEEGGKLSFDFNFRGIEHVPTAGGWFIVTGESGDNRAVSISKDGKTWDPAAERPERCGEQLRGIAGSKDAAIIASATGHVCRSTDGTKWTDVPVTDRFTSPPLWTGTEFWIYSGNQRFKSLDGQTWTSEPLQPSNLSIGPVARSPAGTLVAANDGWMVWYEKQQFFRSTDGLHWEILPAGSFTGSHPIYFIEFGEVAATPGCGTP